MTTNTKMKMRRMIRLLDWLNTGIAECMNRGSFGNDEVVRSALQNYSTNYEFKKGVSNYLKKYISF